MNFRALLIVGLVFSLSMGQTSFAIGTDKELKQSVIEGKQPPYIAGMMEAFAAQLIEFADVEKIRTPREKAAFLGAVVEILKNHVFRDWGELHDAYLRSSLSDAFRVLNEAEEEALKNHSFYAYEICDEIFDAEWSSYLGGDYEGFRSESRDAIQRTVDAASDEGMGVDQLEVLTFRMIERDLFNELLVANLRARLKLAYTAILDELHEDLVVPIFADKSAWETFREKISATMRPDVQAIVGPIFRAFNQLMPTWSKQTHRWFPDESREIVRTVLAVHHFGRNKIKPNLLGRLPKDLIIYHILPLVFYSADRVAGLAAENNEGASSPKRARLDQEIHGNDNNAPDDANLRAQLTQEVIAGAPLLNRAEIADRVDEMMANPAVPMELDNNAPMTAEEIINQELRNGPNRFFGASHGSDVGQL